MFKALIISIIIISSSNIPIIKKHNQSLDEKYKNHTQYKQTHEICEKNTYGLGLIYGQTTYYTRKSASTQALTLGRKLYKTRTEAEYIRQWAQTQIDFLQCLEKAGFSISK